MNNKRIIIGGHLFLPAEEMEVEMLKSYPDTDNLPGTRQARFAGYMMAHYNLALHYLNQQDEQIKQLTRELDLLR